MNEWTVLLKRNEFGEWFVAEVPNDTPTEAWEPVNDALVPTVEHMYKAFQDPLDLFTVGRSITQILGLEG